MPKKHSQADKFKSTSIDSHAILRNDKKIFMMNDPSLYIAEHKKEARLLKGMERSKLIQLRIQRRLGK
jgi:hypothetical protein